MTLPASVRALPSDGLDCPGRTAGLAVPDGTPRGSGATRTGSEKRQRAHVVGVRLTADERSKLESRAGDSGQSLGAYLRACAIETAGPRSRRRAPPDRALLARTNADLNRIGSNINQIARALNRGRDAEPDSIGDAADELRATLAVLRRALGYDRQG